MVKNKGLPDSARLCLLHPPVWSLSLSLFLSVSLPGRLGAIKAGLSCLLSLSHWCHSSWGCPLDPAEAGPCQNLDWWSISHMVIYMFQCYSLKSSHPRPLPQSPKVCSLHLCLFCYLAYRVIITIFLNSIYMHIYCIGAFLSDILHSV